MPIQISDLIQKNDIGFGYGALAAGADILIAEGLLEEGADLYLALPKPKDEFIATSVEPFGSDWVARFHACFDAAKHVKYTPVFGSFDETSHILMSARIAMGQAFMRGQLLRRDPLQVILQDPDRPKSLSQQHAIDWAKANRTTLSIMVESDRIEGPPLSPSGTSLSYLMRHGSSGALTRHYSLKDALYVARQANDVTYHIHFDSVEAEHVLSAMETIAVPETLFVSEDVACYASLMEPTAGQFTFAGTTNAPNTVDVRCFTVN